MANAFTQLLETYRRGRHSVFALGPFLPIETLRRQGLRFNQVLQESEAMTQAALANLELGFESTVLPFDLNVEAELLGAEVRYHEAQEGVPVYPTIGDKIAAEAADIDIPDDIAAAGRLPDIMAAIGRTRSLAAGRGAVGAFVPGPFTLAGQVMDMDNMFLMTIKRPDTLRRILDRLTRAIIGVRDAYMSAGAQFIVVEEGGATAISPRLFETLILPCLQEIFTVKRVPHVLFMTGNAERFIGRMLQCGADGLGVDQACDLETVRGLTPPDVPLAAVVGAYTMLADAQPEEIRATVRRFLDKGPSLAMPPADIYPPAKLANISAFVDAARTYAGTSIASSTTRGLK